MRPRPPDERPRELINALVRAPKDAEITQQQLAEQLGQRQTFVSEVDTGECRLDVAEFVRNSRVIGVDLSELIGGAETS